MSCNRQLHENHPLQALVLFKDGRAKFVPECLSLETDINNVAWAVRNNFWLSVISLLNVAHLHSTFSCDRTQSKTTVLHYWMH